MLGASHAGRQSVIEAVSGLCYDCLSTCRKVSHHVSSKLNALYRSAAEELAHRVTSTLGDEVDSIVLYGSTARGVAGKHSDVDVLVISPNPKATKDRISSMRSDLVWEGNFTFFISLVHLSGEDFLELVRLGSPFAHDALAEGVVLYDNGTFSRIRQAAFATRR